MKTTKIAATAVLMLILSVLSVAVSLWGLIDRNFYQSLVPLGLVKESLLPGVVSQDVVSVLSGVALVVLSVSLLIRPTGRTLVAALGLAGYFLYGYGLYAFSGLFTAAFSVYIAIFGLSVYALATGLPVALASESIALPKGLRVSVAVFLLLITAVFVPMWLAGLQPFAQARPDLYPVPVLDLGIVMPALALTAVLLLRNKPSGTVLAGVALIKVFTLILSVVAGYLIQLIETGTTDFAILPVYGTIVAVSLMLGVWYFKRYGAVQDKVRAV